MTSWDDMAEAAAQPFGDCRSHDMRFVGGAEWQRDQLRTAEAIERASRAVFDGQYSGSWDDAAEWMREDCRIATRAAITALLGDTQ